MGAAYNLFLVRGPSPEQIFGNLLSGPLEVAAREGSFTLVRRR